MSKEIKYYSVDELKVGMRVSVRSLDKIVGIRILLDSKTYERDLNEIGFGTIVFIGNGSYKEAGINIGDTIVICNSYDATNDEEDDDWDEF